MSGLLSQPFPSVEKGTIKAMMRTGSFVFLGALVVAAHGGSSSRGLRGRSFAQLELLTDMHPELVSQFLSELERQWMGDAVAAKSGKMADLAALRKMQTSCAKVSNSILAGSDGDKDKVQEYMDNVCTQDKGQQGGRAVLQVQ